MDTPVGQRELIEQGFKAVNLRLDDMRGQMLSMHAENSERLDKINGRVSKAHELIAGLQEAVGTLKVEFALIRSRWHEFRSSVQESIGKSLGLSVGKGELAPVTRMDAKMAVGIFILGMTALTALMKIVGKL